MKGKYVALALLLTLMVPTAKSQQAYVTNDPVAFAMGNTGIVAKASGYSIYNNSADTAFSEYKGAMAFSYLGWSPSGADAKVPSLSGYYRVGQRMTLL